MNKYHFFVTLLLCCTCSFVSACSGNEEDTDSDQKETATEENIGRMCEEDLDCGTISVCENSICARQCQTGADCSGTGNVTDVCARAPSDTPRFVCIDDAFVTGCTAIKEPDAYCDTQESGTICCTAGGNPEGYCVTQQTCDENAL